jgi:hypothetical protein
MFLYFVGGFGVVVAVDCGHQIDYQFLNTKSRF